MLMRYRDGKAYTPCEVCEEPADSCCVIDDQPMLWFCVEHYREHVVGAHPESLEARALGSRSQRRRRKA
jgi:hypothetical protein